MKLDALMEKFAANARLENAAATDGVWKFSADGISGRSQARSGEAVSDSGSIESDFNSNSFQISGFMTV